MGDRKSYAQVEAERTAYPLGKPKPYTPGHKNYLDPEYLPMGPNRIPLGERVINTILALFILGYGAYGVIVDDLFLPGRRTAGMHLHGMPAVTMFMAMCCAAAMLLAVVVDHYDTRANEIAYRRFAAVCKYAAAAFFAASWFLNVTAGIRP